VQILDEMPVFYNLNAVEKREVLIVILQIVRNLDDESLVKAWQQSIARTRLFFKLLEEGLVLFEVAILFEILVPLRSCDLSLLVSYLSKKKKVCRSVNFTSCLGCCIAKLILYHFHHL
jgi:hypothetical protein